ncbi:hypothetical protein BPOR_0169g00020 [Botrytis porri]|uniref:Uncharacterized protein n=1 Tax=Botrytis porri TaxID=87229 RepID=A0A4Z1KV64_9HELO|nr:hypothetical protein BPOR_0169g00020 [Botrytis porri]
MAPPPPVIRTTGATMLRQDHQLWTQHNTSNRNLLVKAVVLRRLLRVRENKKAMLQSSNDEASVGTVHKMPHISNQPEKERGLQGNRKTIDNDIGNSRARKLLVNEGATTKISKKPMNKIESEPQGQTKEGERTTKKLRVHCQRKPRSEKTSSTTKMQHQIPLLNHHNSDTSNDTSRKEQVLDFDDLNPLGALCCTIQELHEQTSRLLVL